MAQYLRDYVLPEAQRLAWEALTDEQRERYLAAAVKASGTKTSKSVLRRWSVQTGPNDGSDGTG
jgi:hypothetical protein